MCRMLRRCGMQLLLALGTTMAIIFLANGLRADNVSTTQVRKIIEGTWTLAEWNIDGNILKPPEVDGRFSIHDGMVMFFLERRSSGNEIFVSGYGSYDLNESNWSYHYEHFRTLVGAGKNTQVYADAPWPGIRTFEFRTEEDKFILDDKRDGAMFVFDSDGFNYVENGNITRVWTSVRD